MKNGDEKRLKEVESESDETHEALLKLLFFRVKEKYTRRRKTEKRERKKSEKFIQQKKVIYFIFMHNLKHELLRNGEGNVRRSFLCNFVSPLCSERIQYESG